MATMTKQATMTWASAEDQKNPGVNAARETYIANAVAAGTTDGVPVIVSDVTTIRYWLDQTSADDWYSFIVQTAVDNNVTPPTVIIADKT
jgi:hypothetical protein